VFLTDEQLTKYDEVVKNKLSPETAKYLENGKHSANGFDPKSK